MKVLSIVCLNGMDNTHAYPCIEIQKNSYYLTCLVLFLLIVLCVFVSDV